MRRFSDNKANLDLHHPFTVTSTLDRNTLYISKSTARALGWTPEQDLCGVQLTLHGWAPGYFAIAQTNSDSGEPVYPEVRLGSKKTLTQHIERLARATIESSRNPAVLEVLEQLKDQ